MKSRNPLRRILTVAEVLSFIPISRTTLWRLERDGMFPKSTYVSANRRGWYEDEIAAWQWEPSIYPRRGVAKEN